MRTRTPLSSWLAKQIISALDDISIPRIIGLNECWDTGKIRAKTRWWDRDQLSWAKVITPGVPIGGLTWRRGWFQKLRLLRRMCRNDCWRWCRCCLYGKIDASDCRTDT